jgi:enoyl-CoA hydratase/carnithine racemase
MNDMTNGTSSSTADVQISIDNDVQIIRLTRVAKKNALTGDMYNAMALALDRADASPDIACTVFLGGPGAFTAGNDINDFARRSKTAPAGTTIATPSTDFIRRLPKTKKPLIAGVDGLAIGIGVTLLLHCDLVFASPNASLRAPFLDLGIIQEAGSSLAGPERLGYQNAFELLVLGVTWTAERAYAAGLVNAVVPSDQLEATALKAAHALASKPRAALIAARRLMKGDVSKTSTMIEDEVQEFKGLMQSPEAREAFAAFLEKRKPDFKKARGNG